MPRGKPVSSSKLSFDSECELAEFEEENLIDYDEDSVEYEPEEDVKIDSSNQIKPVEEDQVEIVTPIPPTQNQTNNKDDHDHIIILPQELKKDFVRAVLETANFSPNKRDLYATSMDCSALKGNEENAVIRMKIVDLFLQKFANEHKITSTIVNSVVNHFKKIDDFRNEILVSTLQTNLSSDYDRIKLKGEHINCDPDAELFIETICSDRGNNLQKFQNIIRKLHVPITNDDDLKNKAYTSDILLSHENVWSFRSLFLHQYVFALLESKSEDYVAVEVPTIHCPLSLTSKNSHQKPESRKCGKCIFFPNVTCEIAGHEEDEQCDHILSCPCTKSDTSFVSLFLENHSECFEDYWKSKHKELSDLDSNSQILEEHLLFGDKVIDPELSEDFMEGRVGTNTFNIMHHMMYHCMRLVFSYHLMKHNNDSIVPTIELDKVKKVLKWKNFMYELPTRTILENYSSLQEYKRTFEGKPYEEITNEYYLGGQCNDRTCKSFLDTYYNDDQIQEATADTDWNSIAATKTARKEPQALVSAAKSDQPKGLPVGMNRFNDYVSELNRREDAKSTSQKKTGTKTPPASSVSTTAARPSASLKSPLASSASASKTGPSSSSTSAVSTSSTLLHSNTSNRSENRYQKSHSDSRYNRRDYHGPRSFDHYGPASNTHSRSYDRQYDVSSNHSYRDHHHHNYGYRNWNKGGHRFNDYDKDSTHDHRDHSDRSRDYYHHYGDTHHYQGRRYYDSNTSMNVPVNTVNRKNEVNKRKSYEEESDHDRNKSSSSDLSSQRRESFSSSISTSISTSSKRMKTSSDSLDCASKKTSSGDDLSKTLETPDNNKKKPASEKKTSDQTSSSAGGVSIVQIGENIKLLSFPDGTTKFLDVKNSSFIPDPDATITKNNAVAGSSTSRRKSTSNSRNIPTRMGISNQTKQMAAMNRIYPPENRSNLLDGVGDNLNAYKADRNDKLWVVALNNGIVTNGETILRQNVALKERVIGSNSQPKLHFGSVNRAIGLNSKGVFLWKICFGAGSCNCFCAYEGYETVSTMWNAVVTLEEIRNMLHVTNLNDPNTYIEIKSAPERGDNTNVHRPDFVDNLEQDNQLYLCSSPISPTTVMEDVNERINISKSHCDSSYDNIHDSITDSAYYAVCNHNVCFGSMNKNKLNNNSRDGRQYCVVCGTSIDGKSCSSSINDTVGQYYPRNPLAMNINLDHIHICTKCVCDSVQSFKYFCRNAHLMQCLNATVLRSCIEWGEREECNVSICWHKYFAKVSNKLKQDKVFKDFVGCTLSYRIINTRSFPWIMNRNRKQATELKEHLDGASFFDCHDFSYYTKNAISMPIDVDFGVILLPEGDFILLCESNFQHIDSVHLSLCETSKIKRLQLNGRAGGAGGIVSTETNSHSMTKNTKKSDNLFVPSIKGVGISCIYKNVDNERKSFSGVYNDVFMDRVAILDKVANIHNNISYARITVSEMKTRTASLILASELGLLSKNEMSESFMFLQKKDSEWAKATEVKRQTISPSDTFSRFEILLLHQACTTGEMRNHQALHAHRDGNKSHLLESLSLFGRIDEHDVYKVDDLSQVVDNMVDGQLYLPTIGIVLSISCCTISVHCKLKQTVHIPDLSRNMHNWSKVHGPSGSWTLDKSSDSHKKDSMWYEEAMSCLVLK